MSENLETILDSSLEFTETVLDSSSESNCTETSLDNDTNELNGGFGEFTKHISSMFQNPKMQNALNGVFGSITEKLKPQSGSILTLEDITIYNVSYEDIMIDINTRVVPHLLSRLSGDGLSNIHSVNIDKGSKMFGSISLLYSCGNCLIQKGNNQTQIELYRDRLVGQMVWANLYEADNFYSTPTNETNELVADTMKGFATGVLNSQLSSINLGELFKNLNTKLDN